MKLIISSPQLGSREMQLTTSASIGRSVDNTISIDDPGIARYHAMIELRDDAFWLNDLGSANGTAINGTPLKSSHLLKAGDTISLGSSTAIRISAPETKAAAPPPTANDTATASAPAPAPAPAPASPENNLSAAHIAIAGVMVFLLLGFVGAALWIIRSKDSKPVAQNNQPVYYTPPPTIQRVQSTESAKPTATPDTPKQITLSAGTASGIEGLVGKLAGQLSGKGNYIFDPEMVSAIAARTSDYRVDVTAQAKAYRLEIDREFSNAKNLKPLLGHILALSRSRYGQSSGGGVGVWQLPVNMAQEYAPGEDLSSLNSPKRSTYVAAAHLQEIMTIFSPEDFMYALSCFGQTRSVAGDLNKKLQMVDPNDRRDFWKQVKAGIVSRDGADKVVRFFAAGIVGEYPANFGLTGATAFSDL